MPLTLSSRTHREGMRRFSVRSGGAPGVPARGTLAAVMPVASLAGIPSLAALTALRRAPATGAPATAGNAGFFSSTATAAQKSGGAPPSGPAAGQRGGGGAASPRAGPPSAGSAPRQPGSPAGAASSVAALTSALQGGGAANKPVWMQGRDAAGGAAAAGARPAGAGGSGVPRPSPSGPAAAASAPPAAAPPTAAAAAAAAAAASASTTVATFQQMREEFARLKQLRTQRQQELATAAAAQRAAGGAGALGAVAAASPTGTPGGGIQRPGGLPAPLGAGGLGPPGSAAAAAADRPTLRVKMALPTRPGSGAEAVEERSSAPAAPAIKTVTVGEDTTVRDLSTAMGVPAATLLEKLEELGEAGAAIDGAVDPDIAELLVTDAGHNVKRTDTRRKDRVRTVPPSSEELAAAGAPARAPIVTVMGHVDHGKTTLMDALRGADVASREAGGITQGVAAFSVALRAAAVPVGDRAAAAKAGEEVDAEEGGEGEEGGVAGKKAAADAKSANNNKGGKGGKAADKKGNGNNKPAAASAAPSSLVAPPPERLKAAVAATDVMTFLDTPGHALFSSMRRRGAALTDIVVLVIDGKDGLMPQTRECIDLILSSEVPCVVALTKCDMVSPEAALERVSKQLLEVGLVPESLGGSVQVVPISARTGYGLQDLKDAIALTAEMLDLRAVAEAAGEAVIIDCKNVKGSGAVVDCVVRWGTLRVGDVVVAGEEFGRVRSLQTDFTAAASLNKTLAGAAGAEGGDKSGSKGGKGSKGAPASSSSSSGAAAAAFALETVDTAVPGMPVRVSGLKGIPPAGEDLLVVESEERAKAVIDGRKRRAEAKALLQVAAVDAARRAAVRKEYQDKRQRKMAYDLAVQRERQRHRLNTSGVPIPAHLVQQPWEVAVLAAGAPGAARGPAGNREQGDQQKDVSVNYTAAVAALDSEASEAEGGGEGEDGEEGPPPPPPQVSLIVRADSAASLVAIQDAVERIKETTDAVLPRIASISVGEVSERDVETARDLGAHLLAFNTKVSSSVQKAADKAKLKIRTARVIYHLLDDLCDLLADYMPFTTEEVVVGVADIRQIFTLNATKKSEPSRVAGCLVTEGTLNKSGVDVYRILRNGDVVGEVKELAGLLHFKDKVESVKKGSECGVTFAEGFETFEAGDKISAVKYQKVKAKLEVRFG